MTHDKQVCGAESRNYREQHARKPEEKITPKLTHDRSICVEGMRQTEKKIKIIKGNL